MSNGNLIYLHKKKKEEEMIVYILKVGFRFFALQIYNQSHLMIWQKNHIVVVVGRCE
jgi:hypothetical protein